MPKINGSKTYKVPRRAFAAERLDAEMKLAGQFGLKNKHEIWRVAYTLSNLRRAARELLTLDDKDPRRLFEGIALFPWDGIRKPLNVSLTIISTLIA